MEEPRHVVDVGSKRVSLPTSSTCEPVNGNCKTSSTLSCDENFVKQLFLTTTLSGGNYIATIISDQNSELSGQNSGGMYQKEDGFSNDTSNKVDLSKSPVLDTTNVQLDDGSSCENSHYESAENTKENFLNASSISDAETIKSSPIKEDSIIHQSEFLDGVAAAGDNVHDKPLSSKQMVSSSAHALLPVSKSEDIVVKSKIPDEPIKTDALDDPIVQLSTVVSLQNGSGEAKKSLDKITAESSHESDPAQAKFSSLQPETEEHSGSGKKNKIYAYGGLVDTAAPFESVREAVTKFGGIVDWKAHKIKTAEKRKQVELELEKVREEIPKYKQQSDAAESAKTEVLQELESMKRLVEELKLTLEKAQLEENQANQDSELAKLRVEEIEQGVANEASVAAKAQLEVAKSRHEAAVQELKSVRDELDKLKTEYVVLLEERNLAAKRAEEAASELKEAEKAMEGLTLELIMAKESFESAQTAHMEAEEKRIGAAMTKEQDELAWERELKEAEEEVQKLSAKVESVTELKSKLDSASQLLNSLTIELMSYMESKLTEESTSMEKEEELTGKLEEIKKSETDRKAALASVKQELEEVKISLEKAKNDVNCLKIAAVSLKSELEREKAALTSLKQREGMASIAVASLEAEVERTRAEVESVKMKERQAKEKMVDLPRALQQAAQGADQAKAMLKSVRAEHRKARENVEQAKAAVTTIESRLNAALKEIEAAKASETLALAAAKALLESESASEPDSPAGVTLSLEEYNTLSKLAQEAEERAKIRVAEAISQIEVAKESELKCLEELEETNREMTERKEALRLSGEKAERAKQGKLRAEQDLRKWRAEHEQRRRMSDAARSEKPAAVNSPRSPLRSFEESKDIKSFDGSELSAMRTQVSHERLFVSTNFESPGTKLKMKKKKSLFPRIVMFLKKKS